MPDLKSLVASPASFRAALIVDTDRGPKPLGTVLDLWQRKDFEALDPAWLAVTRRGSSESPKLRAYLERPRGHSKTADLAVQVAWALYSSPRQIVLVAAAADQDQARLLRDAIAKLVRLNPWLASVNGEKYLDVQASRIVNKKTGSVLDILSADAESSYGLTPDAVIVDELTHWGDGRGEALWVSLFSAAAKRSGCLLVIISNAGTGEGVSWQWKIREAARTDDAWHFSRLDGPIASWISAKHLAEQQRMLPTVAFERLWMNRWTSGVGDAISESDLLASIRLDAPPSTPEPGLTYVAGLDLGLSRDASALVVVGCDPATERYRLTSVQAWTPKPGIRVNVETIERAVIDARKLWNLSTVSCDPWQASYLAERLRAAGVPTVETPFVARNLQGMASAVIESFSDRRIELYDDPALLADLRALRIVEKSFGYRLDAARTKTGHADRAIALALAMLAARNVPRVVCGFHTMTPETYRELPTLRELLRTEKSNPAPAIYWQDVSAAQLAATSTNSVSASEGVHADQGKTRPLFPWTPIYPLLSSIACQLARLWLCDTSTWPRSLRLIKLPTVIARTVPSISL